MTCSSDSTRAIRQNQKDHPGSEAIEYFREALERTRDQAQSEGLPPSSPWTLSFVEPQIALLGGAQALCEAAKSATRQLGISLRVTVYEREGDQLITVNNRGPYKRMKREPRDTVTATSFALAPSPWPRDAECNCRQGYCLSGESDWPEWTRQIWYSIRPDTDLRTLPEEYRKDDDLHLLFAQMEDSSFYADDSDVLDLTAFFEGAELGPLADVQVYATNARGEYRGSSHGVMCRRAGTLGGYGPLPSEKHEILPLSELVEILRPLHGKNSFMMPLEQLLTGGLEECDRDLESRWCVYCHGYSVRRFTPEQCRYYRFECERWSQRVDDREMASVPS